jgi:hypothetical protein
LDLILVHFGERFAPHIIHCIEQIRVFTGDRIVLFSPSYRDDLPRIREVPNVHCMDNVRKTPAWNRFGEKQFLSKYKLNEFWRYACERFYAIEAIMKSLGIDRALHLENDNLIYSAPPLEWLAEFCGSGIGLPRINDQLLSAGIMYIGSIDSLEKMNGLLNGMLERGESELLKKYGGEMANEMFLLDKVDRENPGLIKHLPIVPKNDGSQFVYDCASWGQFFGGTFHAPDISFAHESHIIGRLIIGRSITALWRISAGKRFPVAINKENQLDKPIYNLHIHSKNLAKWRTKR